MALPWLGFVKPVVDVPPVALDGPDPLTSAAYAKDYDEVRRVGAVDSPVTERTDEETAIARFFSANPVLTYRMALCDLLDGSRWGCSRPPGCSPGSMPRLPTPSSRPGGSSTRSASGDRSRRSRARQPRQPATSPQTGWVPLVANPAYSDYTSGHAAATSPFAEVVRQTLGDDTRLVLKASADLERTYDTLTALEHDAFNARIWGGLHFRDAMDDGYYLGHTTAQRVLRVVR